MLIVIVSTRMLLDGALLSSEVLSALSVEFVPPGTADRKFGVHITLPPLHPGGPTRGLSYFQDDGGLSRRITVKSQCCDAVIARYKV